jgi:phage terminase large subunit-like protein
MKLRIKPEALARLSPEQRRQAEAQLRELEDLRRANPLVFYEPHEKQRTLHASTDPLKLFLGGNRAGKTTCGINDDLIQALPASALPEHLLPYKRWEPPFYCRIVVPDLGATLEGVTLQKIREWCPPSELAGGTFSDAWDSKLRVLRFRCGSWFQFLSNDQDLDKFGGAALHRVHYDEEPREDIRRECLMRLIDYDGDELFTMTPQWGMSWVFGEIFEPWEAGALTDCTIVVVDIDDNPHLGVRGKERAMAGLSSEERQARKAGRFVHFAGLIYPEFSRERHVIPAISELPPGVTVLSGIDPGIGRQAAIVFAYLDFDGTLVVFDEIALQGANVEQICAEYHRRCERWKIRPRFNVIDPSARNRDMVTGKALREEYTKHGVVTILGQNSYELGFNIGKERFERTPPGILITADCPELVRQLGRYRWRSDPRSPEGTPASGPIKQDDHLCDALRYLWCSPMVTPERPSVEESSTMKDRLLREHLKHLERPRVQHPAGPGVFA